MAEKQIISTIKYLAAAKPVFFLSEVLPCLDDPLNVPDLLQILAPRLPALGLRAKKINGDVEITRIPPAQPYVLTPEECERQEAFFTGRRIPDLLAQSIEEYITRKTGKPWDDPVIIERLRKAIVAQKDDYWKPAHKRSLRYTKAYSVIGYLAYHFPVYVMQTEYLLRLLAREGLLKKTMT